MTRKGALAADPTSCDWVLAFDLMNDKIITMAAAARPSASLPTTHRLVYFGPRAPTLQITLFCASNNSLSSGRDEHWH